MELPTGGIKRAGAQSWSYGTLWVGASVSDGASKFISVPKVGAGVDAVEHRLSPVSCARLDSYPGIRRSIDGYLPIAVFILSPQRRFWPFCT